MKQLERRIKRLEKKLNSKGKGGWALEYARKKLNSIINISIGDHKPHRPHTEEDIIGLAKTVSKFSSPEEYEASLPPMDFSALDKALDAIESRLTDKSA